jgi:predicted HTH transcriptional regulator
LLIIHVPHSIGPYYLKSEGPERSVYVRFGSTKRSVDAEMLDSLRLLAKKVTYDELPHPEGHLDSEVMKFFFDWVGKKPTAQALENLGVETSRSGKKYPSNGGYSSIRIKPFAAFPRCAGPVRTFCWIN